MALRQSRMFDDAGRRRRPTRRIRPGGVRYLPPKLAGLYLLAQFADAPFRHLPRWCWQRCYRLDPLRPRCGFVARALLAGEPAPIDLLPYTLTPLSAWAYLPPLRYSRRPRMG
jgi:hypothetical protein